MNKRNKTLILFGVFVLLILLRISVTINPITLMKNFKRYIWLFIDDRLFWKAVFNIIIPLLFAALICVIVLVLVRHLRLKKSKMAFFDRNYLLCAFCVLYLINRIITLLSIIPFIWLKYDAGSMTPVARKLDIIYKAFFRPNAILDTVIYALFFCIILWIIDGLKRRNALKTKTNI